MQLPDDFQLIEVMPVAIVGLTHINHATLRQPIYNRIQFLHFCHVQNRGFGGKVFDLRFRYHRVCNRFMHCS